MHNIQEKLLGLINNKNISGMSLREIGSEIGISSAQQIRHHLYQLEKKGFIRIDTKNKEIIKTPKKSADGMFMSLPIVGSANCGPAEIFADERIEGYLKVSPKMVPHGSRLFVLRASGNSMNKATIKNKSIEDGDFVVVDANKNSAESGDYVVSVIDGSANIKKFVVDRQNERIVLKSESTQNYLPIFIHEDDYYLINGKVVDVIKK